MDEGATNDLFVPRRLLAVARRRAWIVVICAVLAGVASYVVTRREAAKYSATASVLFQQDQLSQQLFGFGAAVYEDSATVSATNVTLASEPILSVNTAQALGRPFTRSRVDVEVSVAPAGASNVVNVTATDSSPTEAAKLANTYVDQLINYQEDSGKAQIVRAAAQLQSQVNSIRANHGAASQLSSLETRIAQLQELAAIQTGNVQLAGPATVPSSPSSPKTTRDVALGLVAGLLIGLLAAFLAERIDNTIRDADEATSLMRLPLLASIPRSPILARRSGGEPLSPTVPGETFRLLDMQLRYFNVDRQIKSVLVTSATPGDGKTTVAWNLARTAAARAPDSSVLVVDCDLRHPMVATMAGLNLAPGLGEVLTHDLALEDAVQQYAIEDAAGRQRTTVRVLSAGGHAPNPTELLESQKLRNLIDQLHASYDFVIFDAPPTALVSDVIPLMNQVSGILVVVRLLRTRRDAALRLRDQLVRLGVRTLGLVLNDVTGIGASYRDYPAYGGGTMPQVTLSPPGP